VNRLSERIKALEEKVETMDMLIQSLHSELKKALEDIETLNEESDKEILRQGLTSL
jgi:prefoldin subunit 5